MLEFLPENVKDGLRHLNARQVYEIRLRADKPTSVNYRGKYCYLGEYGVTESVENALRCDTNDIADCVFRAGKYSVYSVEEQIKRGFLTERAYRLVAGAWENDDLAGHRQDIERKNAKKHTHLRRTRGNSARRYGREQRRVAVFG